MPLNHFDILPFASLTTEMLYAILRLRSEVFVVEQACAYQDLDDHDHDGFHVMGTDGEGRLVAYARIHPPGVFDEGYWRVGRIVTAPSMRGTGAGKAIVARALAWGREQYPGLPIKISAQLYLKAFYEGFGFAPVGKNYLLDGIPHVEMVCQK